MDNIPVAIVVILFGVCILSIVVERVRDRPIKGKILYIVCMIAAICAYAGILYLIRAHPALVAFRKRYGTILIMLYLFGIYFCVVLGGILNSGREKYDPSSKKKRIGDSLSNIAFILAACLLPLFPFFLALIID